MWTLEFKHFCSIKIFWRCFDSKKRCIIPGSYSWLPLFFLSSHCHILPQESTLFKPSFLLYMQNISSVSIIDPHPHCCHLSPAIIISRLQVLQNIILTSLPPSILASPPKLILTVYITLSYVFEGVQWLFVELWMKCRLPSMTPVYLTQPYLTL